MNLINKNITLIIRQKHRALSLKNLLKSAGYDSLIQPVFKIKSLEHKNLNYKDFSAIMFTSVTTVEILNKKNINKNLKELPTFCVGKVTNKTALEAGYNCIKTNATSGKSLEKVIIKSIKPSEKKILIVGGKKIAHNPIESFNSAGLKSERIIIYDTIPINKINKKCTDAINNKKIKNIIVYSPETAKTFIKLTKHLNIKDIKAICLGKTTGNIFKKNNWKKIQVVNDINLKTFANALIED